MVALEFCRFEVLWPTGGRGQLAVSGDSPLLGEWDPKQAVRLVPFQAARQIWSGDVLCAGIGGEFRFLVLHPDGDLMRWEPLFCNRQWPGESTSSRACIRATFGKAGMEVVELDIEEVVEPLGCDVHCSFLSWFVWMCSADEGSRSSHQSRQRSSHQPQLSQARQPLSGSQTTSRPALSTPPKDAKAAQERDVALGSSQGTPAKAMKPKSAPVETRLPLSSDVQITMSILQPSTVENAHLCKIEAGTNTAKASAQDALASSVRKASGSDVRTRPPLHAPGGETTELSNQASLGEASCLKNATHRAANKGLQTDQWSHLPSVGTWFQPKPCQLLPRTECTGLPAGTEMAFSSSKSLLLISAGSMECGIGDGSNSIIRNGKDPQPPSDEWHSSACVDSCMASNNDCNQHGLSYVAVRLWVSCETKPGEQICITGSDPTLGEWDLVRAKPLWTSDNLFPRWFSDVMLFEAPPQGCKAREVQYKFAVCSTGANTQEATEEEDVGFEDFNRTLLLPPGTGGVLLEPSHPLIFGSPDVPETKVVLFRGNLVQTAVKPADGSRKLAAGRSESAIRAGITPGPRLAQHACEDTYTCGVASVNEQHRSQLCRRGPTMMLEKASGEEDQNCLGMTYVPSLLQDLRSGHWGGSSADLLRDATRSKCIADADVLMDRKSSEFEAVKDGPLQGVRVSPGFCLSSARFCMVRFRVLCATGPGEAVYVVGDDLALGNWDPRLGVPLHSAVDCSSDWTSEDILLDLPHVGPQTRTLHYKFAVVKTAFCSEDWSEKDQVQFENLNQNRSLLISRNVVGNVLEPILPAQFGVSETGGLSGSFAPRKLAVAPPLPVFSEDRLLLSVDSAEKLAATDLETTTCFARQRSVAGGESMLNLVAAATKKNPSKIKSNQCSGFHRHRSVAAGESMLDLASAANNVPRYCVD